MSTEKDSLKKTALLVIALASFMFPFMASAVNIAIPSIGKEFQMHAVTLNWIAASFLLAAALFSVPFGRLADIYGRRRMFVIGVLFYAFSSLLCGLASTTEMLITARVLQGLAGSMYSGAGLAIIVSIFSPGERGKVLGITTAAVYFGLSCGPFLGGILTQHLGWRSIFLINVPISLLLFLLVLVKMKEEWAEAKGEKFDYIGSLLFAITIFTFIFGFSIITSSLGIVLVAVALISTIFFLWFESKTQYPLIKLSMFTESKTYTYSNLAALIHYCATFAVTIMLSLYLQNVKGLSPQAAGFILVMQPVMQALLSPSAGKLSDKIDPQIVASIGIGLTAVGLIMFFFLTPQTGLFYIVFVLGLLGIGFALFSSPNTNAVMSSVKRERLGVASSILGTMRVTGQTLSMSISTLIFALYLGHSKITLSNQPQFMQALKVSFVVFSVLSILAIFASLARGKTKRA